jgi:hypothetical protein
MDSRNTLDTTITLIIQYGIVAIIYFVIFQYRLPYLQTLAIYTGLSMIPQIYMKTFQRSILKGDRSSLPNWTISQDVLFLIIISTIPAFAVPIMASYRFSGLEAVGLFIAGFVGASVAQAVIRRI